VFVKKPSFVGVSHQRWSRGNSTGHAKIITRNKDLRVFSRKQFNIDIVATYWKTRLAKQDEL